MGAFLIIWAVAIKQMSSKNHNGYQDKEICEINRHIEVINGEMGNIQKEVEGCKIEIAVIKTILKGHDKMFWIVISGIIGILFAILTQVFNR